MVQDKLAGLQGSAQGKQRCSELTQCSSPTGAALHGEAPRGHRRRAVASAMPTSERLRYRWHHRALLALVTVVLAIAALEIAVPLVSPQTLPGRFSRIDERVGWAHVPGSKGWWVGAIHRHLHDSGLLAAAATDRSELDPAYRGLHARQAGSGGAPTGLRGISRE